MKCFESSNVSDAEFIEMCAKKYMIFITYIDVVLFRETRCARGVLCKSAQQANWKYWKEKENSSVESLNKIWISCSGNKRYAIWFEIFWQI